LNTEKTDLNKQIDELSAKISQQMRRNQERCEEYDTKLKDLEDQKYYLERRSMMSTPSSRALGKSLFQTDRFEEVHAEFTPRSTRFSIKKAGKELFKVPCREKECLPDDYGQMEPTESFFQSQMRGLTGTFSGLKRDPVQSEQEHADLIQHFDEKTLMTGEDEEPNNTKPLLKHYQEAPPLHPTKHQAKPKAPPVPESDEEDGGCCCFGGKRKN
jgi:hypothetical protein